MVKSALHPAVHGLISCEVIEFSSGLYTTLYNMLVTVVVVPLEDDPPLPPPPDEPVLDDPPAAARSTLPMTLKVTVNASLFGLVNFNVRGSEVSFAVSALSVPSFVL